MGLGQRQVHRVQNIKSILVTRSRTLSERTLCLNLHPQDGQTSPRSRGWELVLSKMHRHHANIQEEVAVIVQTIRKEMKSDLVPLAEEKANYGKIVKTAVRELWSLEYEIEEIQTEFAKGIGSIDIANLTDDFVEDVMLQSKPLQGILMAIRLRQKEKMEQLKAKAAPAEPAPAAPAAAPEVTASA